MTRIGSVGIFNVIKNVPVAYYVSLALIKIYKENSFFINYVLNTSFSQREIWRKTLHVAFPKKINKQDIKEIKIRISSELREQSKIADLLSIVDDLIELNRKKLTAYQNMKKYFLQNMFC